jgi:hypothetical protein
VFSCYDKSVIFCRLQNKSINNSTWHYSRNIKLGGRVKHDILLNIYYYCCCRRLSIDWYLSTVTCHPSSLIFIESLRWLVIQLHTSLVLRIILFIHRTNSLVLISDEKKKTLAFFSLLLVISLIEFDLSQRHVFFSLWRQYYLSHLIIRK